MNEEVGVAYNIENILGPVAENSQRCVLSIT